MKHSLRWTSLILMAACAMLLAACSASGPEATVKTFYQSVANGDNDTAMALVDFHKVKDNQQNMAKAKVKLALAAVKARIDASGGLDSVQVDTVEQADATHAKAHVTLHFKNGETHKANMKLIRVDGQWRVALL